MSVYSFKITKGKYILSLSTSDKELVDAMNLYADEQQNVKKPRTFSDILDIFMPNGPKDNGGILSGTQAKVSELLKRQHDRLNGGE